ncbi:hypothetical protein GCM10009558_083670 [Virgisporangium aurantiacum]
MGVWVFSAVCPNTTTPMSTEVGWAFTKSVAACWAAPSRVGSRSVAVMLLDASTTSITVPDARGTFTGASGRAAPTSSTGTAASRKTYGRCFVDRPTASPVPASARTRRRCSATYIATAATVTTPATTSMNG